MSKILEKFDRCSEKLASQKAKLESPAPRIKNNLKPQKKLSTKGKRSK